MDKAIGQNEKGRGEWFVLIKNLVLAYVVTGIILMLLAFLLYKLRLSEKTISICIIITYAFSTFLAGFLTGKQLKKMKFLWGILLGAAYFVILAVISLLYGRATTMFGKDFFTTILLCIGGGMLGGMVS